MGLRLNQALIGEMTSAEALNAASEEIYQVLYREWSQYRNAGNPLQSK